ncbi:MAG: hypothetical protein Q8P41_15270 [Pseudomonadota bacterium]|nr:hypothetical protein [Pseudomonadota bacterium]
MTLFLAICGCGDPNAKADVGHGDTAARDSVDTGGREGDTACLPDLAYDVPQPLLTVTWAGSCEGFGRLLTMAELSDGVRVANTSVTCDASLPDAGGVTVLTDSLVEVFTVEGEYEGHLLGTRLALAPATTAVADDRLAAGWGPSGGTPLGEGGINLYDASSGDLRASIYEPGVWLGGDLAFAGDVLLSGAPMADDRGGAVYVWAWDGEEQRDAADAIAVHHGGRTLDELGTQVLDVGDIDGDGLPEAVFDSDGGGVLVAGEDLATDEGYLNGYFLGGVPQGRAIAPIGDMDGDGLDEFAMGNVSSPYSPSGHVEIRGVGIEPIAYLGDDRGLAVDIGQYVGDLGEVAEAGRGAFAVLVYPEEWWSDSAEVWVVEGPLCGVVSFDSVGTLYAELTDADYEHQLASAGNAVGVVGNVDGVGGTIRLLSW